MGTVTEQGAINRAFDRLGFGARPAEAALARTKGFAWTLDYLFRPGTVDPVPKLPNPPAYRTLRTLAEQRDYSEKQRINQIALTRWWLGRMATTSAPLRERLTWFWHGHFATSTVKVVDRNMVAAQNQTLRSHALGNFPDLAKAILVDPAMLVWLDAPSSTNKSPNENLAREFMELFTLGVGNYSEADVREAARALTGWTVVRGNAQAVPKLHDDGSKTILGKTANFDANSFADLVLQQPAMPNFIASRMWYRFMGDAPLPATTQARMVSAYGQGNISAMLRALVEDAAFHDDAYALVKPPVDWLAGLLRALALNPATWDDKLMQSVYYGLLSMGQLPFSPPSVGGWPSGNAWLSTATAAVRLRVAQTVIDKVNFRAEPHTGSPAARIDTYAALLGVSWTQRTRDALAKVADSAAQCLTVAACSPEYVISR